MKNTLTVILILFLFTLCACQPQQTDIITEIHKTDGSIVRYVNKSNGYGYNPNITGNLNIGGVEGTNNATIINGGYGGYGYGWGYGSVYYGYPNFYYVPGCVTTPGAAPIPYPMNVYNYNPGIRTR
jgi:hypothetical protein